MGVSLSSRESTGRGSAVRGPLWQQLADGTFAQLTNASGELVGSPTLPAGSIGTSELDATTIQYAEVSISAAEMLALRATPKTLVAAPAAGYVHEFVSAVFIYDYVAVFTESADNIAIRYTNGSGTVVSLTLETTGLLDATSDKMSTIKPLATDVAMTPAAALVLHNTGDGEFGGTGSPCRVKIAYRTHATGL